ncbi:hypothetical protein IEN85_06880 [Pelagicoccus sp. NFK12]|uniref:PRC-barrel domain-containing protein n=1 Tax=Pelagicoccus enzymogenes TaxID=2773457 RepID=A0A927F6N6_9BACT|nr:hypothetical protein [Pelagicoccus enzymogenes]MBD5779212.1 hypothetical protein [Pelagicoccus enzymogenes]
MMRDSHTLFGMPALATDGAFGYVTDFYVDPSYWKICYIVVKTHAWFDGRLALVAAPCVQPSLLGHPGWTMIKRARERIAHLPTVDCDNASAPPSSLDLDTSHFLPSHWETSGQGNRSHGPALLPPSSFHRNGLHSLKSATGYRLETNDGAAGKLQSVALDIQQWAATEFLIESKQWFRQWRVGLPARFVESIDRENRTLLTKLSRSEVREAHIPHLEQSLEPLPDKAGTA